MTTRYQILKSMRSVLEPSGFKLTGSAFHRKTAAGFVEVVHLQAGLGHLVGRSTVNLGIYIPQVEALLDESGSIQKADEKTTPQEYECAIRVRLSGLIHGRYGRERWFDRSDPLAARTISQLLSLYALPWFEKLGSLSAIAEELQADRIPWPTGWGVKAAILKAAGSLEAACALLLKERSSNRDPVKVEVFASRIGIDLASTRESGASKLGEDDRKILGHFFGAYFHEDWPFESENPAGVVANYLRDASMEQANRVARSILRLIACDHDDEALRRLLYRDLGCCVQLPTPEGVTAKDWLYDIVKVLSPKPH